MTVPHTPRFQEGTTPVDGSKVRSYNPQLSQNPAYRIGWMEGKLANQRAQKEREQTQRQEAESIRKLYREAFRLSADVNLTLEKAQGAEKMTTALRTQADAMLVRIRDLTGRAEGAATLSEEALDQVGGLVNEFQALKTQVKAHWEDEMAMAKGRAEEQARLSHLSLQAQRFLQEGLLLERRLKEREKTAVAQEDQVRTLLGSAQDGLNEQAKEQRRMALLEEKVSTMLQECQQLLESSQDRDRSAESMWSHLKALSNDIEQLSGQTARQILSWQGEQAHWLKEKNALIENMQCVAEEAATARREWQQLRDEQLQLKQESGMQLTELRRQQAQVQQQQGEIARLLEQSERHEANGKDFQHQAAHTLEQAVLCQAGAERALNELENDRQRVTALISDWEQSTHQQEQERDQWRKTNEQAVSQWQFLAVQLESDRARMAASWEDVTSEQAHLARMLSEAADLQQRQQMQIGEAELTWRGVREEATHTLTQLKQAVAAAVGAQSELLQRDQQIETLNTRMTELLGRLDSHCGREEALLEQIQSRSEECRSFQQVIEVQSQQLHEQETRQQQLQAALQKANKDQLRLQEHLGVQEKQAKQWQLSLQQLSQQLKEAQLLNRELRLTSQESRVMAESGRREQEMGRREKQRMETQLQDLEARLEEVLMLMDESRAAAGVEPWRAELDKIKEQVLELRLDEDRTKSSVQALKQVADLSVRHMQAVESSSKKPGGLRGLFS